VATVSIASGGGISGTVVVQAIMRTTGVGGGISGSTYALSTADSGRTWECGINAAGFINTIASRFLPGACK